MNGIIIVNKPQGFTSQDVVSKIKKILNIKKAGHTGTLDPMATGVLPVLLGNCTKLSKYLIEHDKTYIATIKFGEKTDTGDSEGKTIETKEINSFVEEDVTKVFESMIGKQSQIPPMYSAIKVNGKKLYEYARNGESIEVKPREIEIYSLKLISINNNELEFEVSSSKGTYIRTLCEDIAEKLGNIGYMKTLCRTKVDRFDISNSYSFESIEKGDYKIISMEDAMSKYPRIDLPEEKKEIFLNGGRIRINSIDKKNDNVYNIYINNTYIGLAKLQNGLIKRDIII